MDKVITIAKVIVPILATVFLGILARKNQLLTPEENRGLQQFVIKFGLPCVIFNSCLGADIGAESISSMLMVIPVMIVSCLWSFTARKKALPYYNLPMIFSAQETGMLGIPLFMILFGVDQAYRIGVLDLAQAITAYPCIAILTSGDTQSPSLGGILKKVITSPLLIMSFLGLTLNVTGAADWLDSVGIGGIITESTGFLAQPISAMMIFSVGYNFSLDRTSRDAIFKISAIHLGYFVLVGLLIQGILCLLPGVDPMTRWALLLFCALPASYLAPTMGKDQNDFTVASGVCSLLTLVTLVVFCVIAAFAA